MSNSVTYDGQFTQPQPVRAARTRYPIPNIQNLKFIHQDFVQLASAYKTAVLGTPHSINSNAFLAEESNFTNLPGGLLSFTWTFCEIPSEAVELPTMASFTTPGTRQQWPKYEKRKEPNIGWIIKEYEDKIFKQPKTKQLAAIQEVKFYNLAAVVPGEPIIVDGLIIPTFKTGDGLNFEDIQINQAFTITESNWKKIKELEPITSNEETVLTTEVLPGFETGFLSPTSTPTINEYNAKVANDEFIQIAPTEISQFLGPIYKAVDLKIKAQ